MGQFIDTQQALVSEAKQKRLEREQKQKYKQRQEELKKQLYYTLQGYFTLEELTPLDYYKQYLKLSNIINKSEIIEGIAKNDAETFYLEYNYSSILNKVYNDFKGTYTLLKQKEAETLKRQKQINIYNQKRQKELDKYIKQQKDDFNYVIINILKYIGIIALFLYFKFVIFAI